MTLLASIARYRVLALCVLLCLLACADTRSSENILQPEDILQPEEVLQLEDVLDSGDSAPAPLSEKAFEASLLQAGNESDDKARDSLLKALLSKMDESDPNHPDLEVLVSISDQWSLGLEKYWQPGDQEMAGEGGYLGGYFLLRVFPDGLGELYPPALSEDSPLQPLWCLYRGRMLIWSAIENGMLTESYFEDGRACLELSAEAFPENRIPKLYLGPPTEEDRPADDANAPLWADHFRHAIERLRQILDFWLDERQAQDGQLGGGWGDDVEVWRNFVPILLGFSSQSAEAGFEALAEGIFALPRLEQGYTNIMTDVEHSGEDTGDTITMMLHLKRDETLWAERARKLAELMQNLWTAENEKGLLQFQSTYFTSAEVDKSNSHACDTNYHTRAVQPALLLWQREGDASLSALFGSWLKTWVEAARSSNRGKPEGVLPSSLSFPSGDNGGPGKDWWNPGCHYTDATFRFPRALSPMLRTLVLAYSLSADPEFLEPLSTMAELRRSLLAGTLEKGEEGSAGWCADKMRGALSDALEKLYLVNGAQDYLDLLASDGGVYARYRLSGEEGSLEDALGNLERGLRTNPEAYTREVRFTDRVFKFHSRYLNSFLPEPVPGVGATLLYEMATGDMGDPLYFPLPAVRWFTPPQQIAVLVEEATKQAFRAKLYHFGEKSRPMSFALQRIEEPVFDWTLKCDGSADLLGEGVPSVQVEIELPARILCVLQAQTKDGG